MCGGRASSAKHHLVPGTGSALAGARTTHVREARCARAASVTARSTHASTMPSDAPASAPRPRVVSLLSATTEIVYALGSGHLLVGRSHGCDWPPAALALPVADRVVTNQSAGRPEELFRVSHLGGLGRVDAATTTWIVRGTAISVGLVASTCIVRGTHNSETKPSRPTNYPRCSPRRRRDPAWLPRRR